MSTELCAIVHQFTAFPDRASVLATLVNVAGSSYRRPGARLLLTENGSRIGSISGGCLEADVVAHAQQIAKTGRAELVIYDTSAENDLVWGVGLGCHGVVKVLIEKLAPSPPWATHLAQNLAQRLSTRLAVVWQADDPVKLGTRLAAESLGPDHAAGVFLQTVAPPTSLVVFGAGDDAQPLVQLAKVLGWTVTVADPRADYATRTRFPSADALVVAPVTEIVSQSAPPEGAIAVVMTHRYVHDVPILQRLLTCAPAYVGLLGPKKRAARILADLARENVVPSLEMLQRFHAPVGLDLGADAPEEVALSIIAEIQASLAHRDGRPLRERSTPIHS